MCREKEKKNFTFYFWNNSIAEMVISFNIDKFTKQFKLWSAPGKIYKKKKKKNEPSKQKTKLYLVVKIFQKYF